MRQMVGLVQRRGIFYFRRTIPEALRADMPAMLATAGPGTFDESAPVSLKGSRAGREFWVSLDTRDEDEARARARSLDGEADALMRLAKRRTQVRAQPKISHLDDGTIQELVAIFRHRKLANDEARRRGTSPISTTEFQALGDAISAREAELRDANARGDCAATHFDHDAIMTVLDAGLNIEIGSVADRRLYLAFVEAELDLMTIIMDRQNGTTRPTPKLKRTEDAPATTTPSSHQAGPLKEIPTLETILEGWQSDCGPREKTFYTFSSKLHRWAAFLAVRGATIHSATLSDASDWKLASLATRSAKSVSNDIFAVKAIYSWAVANGKCAVNPFAGLRHPRALAKGQGQSTKRDFTDEEAVRVLHAARLRVGYRRWVPWISCFTGARISEICQLEVSDIANINGINYFRMMTDDEDKKKDPDIAGDEKAKKKFKNEFSKRLIPMHPKLIEEGFLEFVSLCPNKDIFADATPDRFGNRGGNATKVISRWVRQKLNITDPNISPSHSFRHRFATLCDNNDVPNPMRDRMLGHGSLKTHKKYGEGYWVSTLDREIKKLPLPEGLS